MRHGDEFGIEHKHRCAWGAKGLSLWGLVSAPLFAIASLSLLWTGDPNSTLANVLFAPLALQELVLAVWLIVKGFDADAGCGAASQTNGR